MDNEINAAFRQFLKGLNCLPNLPLWENQAECTAFKSDPSGCSDEIVWVINYLGATRSGKLGSCGPTQAQGSFQISLFANAGCGTSQLYQVSSCIICAIENASTIRYNPKKGNPLSLNLTGQGITLPTTGPLLTGDPSGRVLLPITVPFRAFYCC